MDNFKKLIDFLGKNKIYLISIAVVVIIGATIIVALATKKHIARPSSTNPVNKQQPQTPKSLDPLTIEALRARSYQASSIANEQNLGEQGGYSNTIVAYQSDGLKVYALKSTPDGVVPPAGWPVIILNHGYINPSQYQTSGSEYQEFIAAFTRAGFMVIKPDFRGNGQSQGQPEGGHFSPVYAYDVLNLIASLKQYPGVNPQRIGLFGHSLGGHVSLRVIVVSKDVKATVLVAGVVGSMNDIFYNWPNSPMPYDQPSALVQGKKQQLIQKYGEPKDNPAFWDSVSAINFVDNVTGPVQVNHDVSDSVVPKLFSDHLVSALQKAGKSVEYNVYPGDDHQFVLNRALLLQHILSFYQANL